MSKLTEWPIITQNYDYCCLKNEVQINLLLWLKVPIQMCMNVPIVSIITLSHNNHSPDMSVYKYSKVIFLLLLYLINILYVYNIFCLLYSRDQHIYRLCRMRKWVVQINYKHNPRLLNTHFLMRLEFIYQYFSE